MAGTLLKKRIKGHTYWYYVVPKRVAGKVKLVQQIYLGNAEQILALKQNPEIFPKEASFLDFGLPVALYKIAEELGVIATINSYILNTNPELDVGQYITLAAINRACEPRSKNCIRKWYQKTLLPQLFTIEPNKTISQRFWDAMQEIELKVIPKIEERLWDRVLQQYNVALDILIYDTTNFFNYMSNKTESELSKRGHNKASKDHLRQIGLATSIIRGLKLPLLHELYDGSTNDAKLFPTVITNLVKRIKALTGQVEKITLVFDKGNNSEENIRFLEKEGLNFIGTLKPSEFPQLCGVRLSRYKECTLNCGKEALYFATRTQVYGKNRPVVITYNEEGYKRKKMRFERELGGALEQLHSVRWSRVKDYDAKLREIVSDYYLPASLFTITSFRGKVKIDIDKSAVRAYQQRFGKNLIFTDREDLSPIEIIENYRDRNEIEDLFKEMNDPQLVPFRPVYHWTDHNISVHAFNCILGLLLFRLLQLRAKEAGLELSLEILKEELLDIKDLIFVTNKDKIYQTISKRSPIQTKLFELYQLNQVCDQLGIHS